MAEHLDEVRARLESPETIAPGDDVAPPRPPAPPVDDTAPAPPVARASQQPLNDYGNGQRMVIHFGEDLMFVPRVGWFVWAETHWEKDPDRLAVRRKAQALAPLILQEADYLQPTKREAKLIGREQELSARLMDLEALPTAERAENHASEVGLIKSELKSIEATLKTHKSRIGRLITHAKNAGNSGPLAHMIEEAETSLAVPLDALDADPLEVNTQTGLLRFRVDDLRDDGAGKVASVELIPHHRDARVTKIVEAGFDPSATAPAFEKFLTEIQPNPEVREFLKRWMGVSLTGLKLQRMAVWYGMGANGKSVLSDVIARIAGNYATSVRIESLTGTNRRGGGDATPDLVPLIGARMARTSEPEQGTRLQEGTIKELTGGEPILVRALQQDFVQITPIAKITMQGNHKPEIRGDDDGIWRRVLLVPFEVQIPEDRRDPHLADKLMAEAPGILNWLVEGIRDYLEIGLAPPETVVAATSEYRQDSDPVGQFLTSCCVVTANLKDVIPAAELVAAFAFHLLERGETPWADRTVSLRLGDKAERWRHPETGKAFTKSKASVIQYQGLRFTDAFKRRWEAAPKDQRGKPLSAVRSDASSTPPHPDLDDFAGG